MYNFTFNIPTKFISERIPFRAYQSLRHMAARCF